MKQVELTNNEVDELISGINFLLKGDNSTDYEKKILTPVKSKLEKIQWTK